MRRTSGVNTSGRRASGRLRRHRRSAMSMSLTPMIDVVFLLMIYFLLVGEFRKDERAMALQSTAPSASAVSADPFEPPHPPVRIRVQSQGDAPGAMKLSCDSPLVGPIADAAALTAALRIAREDALADDQLFILSPGEDTRWEHTLVALSAIQRAGFDRINIASTSP